MAFGIFFVMPEKIFAAATKAALADARQVTLIADRESDFYEGWVAPPDAGFALLTRASRDRKLVGACSGGAYLFSVAADWPEADRMVLDLPPRKARAARRARLALKYGTVEICRPRHCSTAGLPKSMTLQLVEGRAAGPERRASEVIAPHGLDFAVALNSTLEGKTDKQKNPHQEASLAWFVARLGGWSSYQRYRPAGSKTIAYGWNQFKTMSQGWNLRQNP